jgi:ABC-type transporter Mla subunit MlaD
MKLDAQFVLDICHDVALHCVVKEIEAERLREQGAHLLAALRERDDAIERLRDHSAALLQAIAERDAEIECQRANVDLLLRERKILGSFDWRTALTAIAAAADVEADIDCPRVLTGDTIAAIRQLRAAASSPIPAAL